MNSNPSETPEPEDKLYCPICIPGAGGQRSPKLDLFEHLMQYHDHEEVAYALYRLVPPNRPDLYLVAESDGTHTDGPPDVVEALEDGRAERLAPTIPAEPSEGDLLIRPGRNLVFRNGAWEPE